MNRRRFLQSLSALAAAPALPSLGALANAAPLSASAVDAATYKWAETIVRAHNSCNLGMLQRHLHIDMAAAEVLKDQLLRNGIISAQANSFGIHKAVKPLFDGAFLKPTPSATDIARQGLEQVGQKSDETGPSKAMDDDAFDYDLSVFDCLSQQAAQDGLHFARYGVGSAG